MPFLNDGDADEDPELTAHGGILRAAKAILNDCGAAAAVDALRAKGIHVTVVGHSLGAGVAVLMTALLNQNTTLPNARCYGYATPACVSPPLAERLKKTVTSCVLRDDAVPRLSEKHCARLAREIVADDENYRERFAKDRAAYSQHVKQIGRKEGMVHADAPPPPPPPPPPEPLERSDTVSSCKSDDGVRPLVCPGEVVYLHGKDGVFEAAAGDHTLPPLYTLQVTPRAVDDHMADNIAAALRAVRARRGRAPPLAPAAPFAKAWTGDAWAPCKICGSDVTWTSAVRGSDAARAYSTHHCRACGGVVCGFCAPAGDAVAADGLAATKTLPDKTIALPSQGVLKPVRVCRACHLGCFDL